MAGEVRRAVIRRLSEDYRIPIAAAAHKYACMSMARKQRLCGIEAQRRAKAATETTAATEGRSHG